MLRKVTLILITVLLATGIFATVSSAGTRDQTDPVIVSLQNVRDYAPATTADGVHYAVDGGELFAGTPLAWRSVKTPAGVIVSAVAVDSANPNRIYIGAANLIAIYRSEDEGATWMQVMLNSALAGGVTDIAVDSAQRLIYVGTDTDGLYRLLDVGGSMVAGGHLTLSDPVVEVAADSTGAGLAFVRTPWKLYRAENGGLSWAEVTDLKSVPTALAIANSQPAQVYVGTADRGVLVSHDGLSWQFANNGLNFAPGSRLFVDDIAVDPAQPQVIYVSSSLILGSTSLHSTPQAVAMSLDAGLAWNSLAEPMQVALTDLLPVSGQPGSVYGLSNFSRSPLALGNAPAAPVVDLLAESLPAVERVTVGAAQSEVAPIARPTAEVVSALVERVAPDQDNWLAWAIAGLALLTLLFAAGYDLVQRSRTVGKMPQPAHVRR